MDMTIYYKGKEMGHLKGDTFKFHELNKELNQFLDAQVRLTQVEDDEGNVIFETAPPTTIAKVAALRDLGYELK